jgi:hypothetical protein
MSPERATAPPDGSAAEADLVPVHVAIDRFAQTVLVRDLLGGFDPARRDLRGTRVQVICCQLSYP